MTHLQNTLGSPNFRQVIRGYLQLHQLTVEGRDESAEADIVRDSLDLPWHALTESDKQLVQGLSVDLFDISEPTTSNTQVMNAQSQKNLVEAIEAKQRQEWERALTLLRQNSQEITPAILSSYRGGIWLEAGYPEVGAVFYEHASKLEPDDAHYEVLFLSALEQSDH